MPWKSYDIYLLGYAKGNKFSLTIPRKSLFARLLCKRTFLRSFFIDAFSFIRSLGKLADFAQRRKHK